MLQFLFDTDHLTLLHPQHPPLLQKLAAHPAGVVGISPITIEKTLRGRLALLSRPLTGALHVQGYARLVSSVQLLQAFPIAPLDPTSESQFQQLRAARLRIGTMDLKIAAITVTRKLTVLTRNRSDFGRVPGLTLEDWSV